MPQDAQIVGDEVDVIRSGQLDQEGRNDIEEQDERLGHSRTNEI
jgi:hypothetical protein